MKLRTKNDGKREREDEQIRQALIRHAGTVKVSGEDTRRMVQSVHRKIEEESSMRRWSARKIAIVAAAVCVFGTITAIAAGKVVGVSSHSTWEEAVYDYDEAKKMKELVGFEIRTPETFSNGYAFDMALPTQEESKDADGNTVQKATSLTLCYRKKGMEDIYITVDGKNLYEPQPATGQAYTHGDVTVYYQCDNYRFVPPNYQVSEEEKAQVEAGTLCISYGSDKVENQKNQSVVWEDGGLYYNIGSFDNTMSAEEFVQMAAEIIDAE